MSAARRGSTHVTVVVDNYNYGAYVAQATDSALAQSHPHVQVIVVDDGSTDCSRQVLDRYADRVHLLLKENGGQASAFNAALPHATGDVVIFLDADDLLHTEAAAQVAHAFVPGVAKISWPLAEIDRNGVPTGARIPAGGLPSGDLRSLVLQQGADCYLSPPCSGNAWSRAFLERVSPLPEEEYRRGADGCLITLAPLFGTVASLEQVLGGYRRHGRNQFWSGTLEQRTEGALARHDVRRRTLLQVLAELRLEVPDLPPEERLLTRWEDANPYVGYLRQLHHDLKVLREVVPEGGTCLLVDGGAWGTDLSASLQTVPFTSVDGSFAGPPRDDTHAGSALATALEEGIRHVAVTTDASWYLQSYPSLARALAGDFVLAAETAGVRVFEVARPPHEDPDQ